MVRLPQARAGRGPLILSLCSMGLMFSKVSSPCAAHFFSEAEACPLATQEPHDLPGIVFSVVSDRVQCSGSPQKQRSQCGLP